MPVDLSLLADVPIFRFLDEAERRTLASLFEERVFAIGETIFHGGEPGDDLFLVKDGRVGVFITSDVGEKIVLAEATRGDVFGEISLLDGGPRTASAAAIEETAVLTLDRDKLFELVQRHPHVALDLLTGWSGSTCSTEAVSTSATCTISQPTRSVRKPVIAR